VPDFEYVHANTPSKSEGGFRGVGEGGAIIGPPTLVNAIADALASFGEIEVDLPLTPAKLLGHIEGRPWPGRPASRFQAGVEAQPSAATIQVDLADVPPEAATMPGGVMEAVHAAQAPAAAPALAAGGVDGLWKMAIASPMGSQEMTGRFETNGGVLTGTLLSEMGDQDFQGTVSGNTVKWEMKVTKPVSLTLKYDLQIDGDQLSGKVKMGVFGNAKVTGERL